MPRDFAARPAPYLQQPSVEIWILLQGWEPEENVFLISSRAERNQNVPPFTAHASSVFNRVLGTGSKLKGQIDATPQGEYCPNRLPKLASL